MPFEKKGEKNFFNSRLLLYYSWIFARADSRQKVQMKIVAVTSHKLFFIDIPRHNARCIFCVLCLYFAYYTVASRTFSLAPSIVSLLVIFRYAASRDIYAYQWVSIYLHMPIYWGAGKEIISNINLCIWKSITWQQSCESI